MDDSSTFRERGARSVAALCDALRFEARRDEAIAVFGELLSPWGDRRVSRLPAFASDLADDHSPFEFSVAFGGAEPELRMLVEAQGDPPGARSNQEAARALTNRLASRFDLPLERFRSVEDLFLPPEPAGAFSLWHAACLWPSRGPAFKIYLNPNVRGPARAGELVEEALMRLGFPRGWSALTAGARSRGPSRDVLAFVSLDLDRGPSARLKIYYRHYDVTAAELEAFCAVARSSRSGDVSELCRAVGGEGPFRNKPVGSCFTFVEGDSERPSNVTLHFPVASYVENDAVVRERVEGWLSTKGLSAEAYGRVLDALAGRPLGAGRGLQSYVSFRREAAGPRATVYFSPELYARSCPDPLARFSAAARPPRPPPTRLVDPEGALSAAHHPLFGRLRREPSNLGHVRLLLAHAVEALGPFERGAPQVGAREDRAFRRLSVRARGLGRRLTDLSFRAAELRPEELNAPGALRPGREAARVLEAALADGDVLVRAGALVFTEALGRLLEARVREELRRRPELDLGPAPPDEPGLGAWLGGAAFSPRELDALWRGAEEASRAAWGLLDGVYRACDEGAVAEAAARPSRRPGSAWPQPRRPR